MGARPPVQGLKERKTGKNKKKKSILNNARQTNCVPIKKANHLQAAQEVLTKKF